MEHSSIDKKTIFKNTILLYTRMVLSLLISLYCSRVVLQALGVVNYGVYDVVGGVVVLFTLISGPLSASTSRFLTFELGTRNQRRLNEVLSVSILIHLGLAILVAVLTESVGLWFVSHVLVIPAERMHAAIWVLHFSALSMFFSILLTPYRADVISHERMDAFAVISLMEVFLKLFIVCSLTYVSSDKLITYAFLISLISVASFVAYWWFCHARFEEARGPRYYDRGVARDILSFMGWSLTGGITGICNGQGLNMLLNVFFGPSVNAARGVALQVQSALGNFSSNIQQALNPQITITYASNRLDDMYQLMAACAKYTYLFLFVLSMPIFCYTPYVLTLWLGHYPAYTVEFIRVILIINLIDAPTSSLIVANHATGHIRKYQIWVEMVYVLTLPLAYLYLRFISSDNPVAVYYITMIVTFLVQCVRISIVLPNIRMRLVYYFRMVIVPLLRFTVPMVVLGCGCVALVSSPGISAFVIMCCVQVLMGCVLTYFVALGPGERSVVNCQCQKLLAKFSR